MKMAARSFLLAAILTIGTLLGIPPAARAGEPGGGARIERAEQTLRTMIATLLADDYPAFLSRGTRDLGRQISPQRFAIMRQDAGPALKNGYALTHDVEVPGADGSICHYWKIIPKKGAGEMHAILVLTGDKVSDLSIQ